MIHNPFSSSGFVAVLVCFSAGVTNAADPANRGIPPPLLEYELSNEVDEPLPDAATRCYEVALNKGTQLDVCDQAMAQISPFDVRGQSAVYANRALIAGYSGNFEAALIDIDHALELLPNEPALLINRGNLLQHMRRYEEALMSYQSAIDHSNGTSAIAYYNRVFVHRLRGDINLAVQDLEIARRLMNSVKQSEMTIPLDTRFEGTEDSLLRDIRDELWDRSDQP